MSSRKRSTAERVFRYIGAWLYFILVDLLFGRVLRWIDAMPYMPLWSDTEDADSRGSPWD